MGLNAVVAASLGLGMGLVGIFAALRKVERPLVGSLYELEMPRTKSIDLVDHGVRIGLERHITVPLVAALKDRPHLLKSLETDLTIIGSDLESLCRRSVIGAAVGAFAPLVMVGVIEAGGVKLPWLLPGWVCLIAMLGGGCFPIVVIRSEASRARRRARTVIGAYLDLVVLCLAGGMGVESALHAAARVGGTEVSEQIEAALEHAREKGLTPWKALGDLGNELGLPELTELSAAVGLAGTEGAKIRATLSAKAASIRRHELADAETEANQVTERLFVPGVLLLIGFLLFIGYPAFARIAAGL